MKSSLLSILACPVCHKSFRFEGTASNQRLAKGFLKCTNGHHYQVKEDVPILRDPKKSRNEFNWTVEFPDLEKYDQIRKEYASYLPKELRGADEALMDEMARIISKHDLVLDIASGMGTLLLRLSHQVDMKTNLLGTDVDEKPLRGAKLKLEEEKTYDRVSLCVMNGKHLALENRKIPCVTSFFGFDNIPEARKAFDEVSRVLTPKGQLVFSSLWLAEGSRSLAEAEKLGYGTTMTENKLTRTLKETGFMIDSVETYYSGRWPYNPMDLLPFKDDWFAHILVSARKV